MVGVITICFVTRFFSLERSWNCYRNVIDRWWFSGNLEVGKKLDVPWKIWKVGGRGVVFGEMLSNWSLRILGSGLRRNGEREIGNEFSLLIVVTFKIHGIQFQSWVIQDFFFFVAGQRGCLDGTGLKRVKICFAEEADGIYAMRGQNASEAIKGRS